MRKKTQGYLALAVAGGILMAAALLLEKDLPKQACGMMTGIGAGLLGFGLSNWRMRRWEEKDPRQLRKNEIEAKDERNVAIRNRAMAVSGNVLQWAVMAAAWLSISLGAPLWVTLLAVGLILAKCILEMCLTARYQREM